MISRAKKWGLPCKYVRGLESFNIFLKDIGPVPEGMVKPTVGRLDHSKGYVFDIENNRLNFEWQPKEDNIREGAIRNAKLGVGIHGLTPEQHFKDGNKALELKLGIHAATTEQRFEWGHRTTAINKQKHTCAHCGFTGAGPAMSRWYNDNCKSKG
jgi:hypothetical protein